MPPRGGMEENMITPKEHFHGSDLEKIERIYGIKKEDITSFAANVNPLGISPKLRKELAERIDAITGYPDREYTSLRKSIAAYVQTDPEHILVGNGSTELISLFIQLIHPKKALILGPTYSEYERELSLAGSACHYYRLKEEADFNLDKSELNRELALGYDLLIICNPNNPTSTSIYNTDMREILDTCKQKNILCLVDETYVEFADDMKRITSIPLTEYYNNIIILRGISKFFASPGLRLGYAVCGNEDLIREVNKRKNPWTINTLAAIAGEIMFSDEEYIKETRALVKQERHTVCRRLSTCENIKLYSPTANFILVKILKEGITAADLFDAAIKKGLMIRDCSTFPFLDQSFIRFCFMSPEKNELLLDLLLEILK